MESLLSLAPVFVFLLALIVFDSFKLISPARIIQSIIWGIIAAALAFLLSKVALNYWLTDMQVYTRYFAPVSEEFIKAFFIFYLISKNRIGFLIDGAILGFAIGAGFAVLENIVYLYALSDSNLLLWAVRGFGAAVMHGGATALFGIVAMQLVARSEKVKYKFYLLSLVIPILLHSFYNHFILSPVLSTLIIMITTPSTLISVFLISEKKLRNWLEIELASEAALLNAINKGEFSKTKSGAYFLNIKQRFSAEKVVDMVCFLRLYLELSIRAKSILLLKEAGFPIHKDDDIKERLAEFKALKKNIGTTGFLALSPVLKMNYNDLWKLNLLE